MILGIVIIGSLMLALYLAYSWQMTVIYFCLFLGLFWILGIRAEIEAKAVPEIQAVSVTSDIVESSIVPALDYETDTSDPLSLAKFYAEKHGIMPQLVQAVMIQETGGTLDPNLVSSAGAAGIMQLMKGTAERYGISADERFIPEKAIEAGIKYLKDLEKLFNYDMNLVLAAYNAGEGNVKKYNGIPPFKETQGYVKRVQAIIGGFFFHGGQCQDKSCLSIKDGATAGGDSLPELFTLAAAVQNKVNIIWFSCFNDKYPHVGKGHKEGRAFDVTLVYLSRVDEAIATIKQIGQEMGLNLKILNEYANATKRSTGGHLHVEIMREGAILAQN